MLILQVGGSYTSAKIAHICIQLRGQPDPTIWPKLGIRYSSMPSLRMPKRFGDTENFGRQRTQSSRSSNPDQCDLAEIWRMDRFRCLHRASVVFCSTLKTLATTGQRSSTSLTPDPYELAQTWRNNSTRCPHHAC